MPQAAFIAGRRPIFKENRVAMYLFMHAESNRARLPAYYLVKFKQMYDIASKPYSYELLLSCIEYPDGSRNNRISFLNEANAVCFNGRHDARDV
jgi:hypothetical protein